MPTRARRRRGARMCTRYPAFFESNHSQCPAILCEISYSGAGIEIERGLPAIGADVRVYVWSASQSEPFELAGRVVGRRGKQFAMEFEEAGQALCQWIDRLHAEIEAEAAAAPARVAEA
jgi:hypothetical protein